jgi:hypothetical protein
MGERFDPGRDGAWIGGGRGGRNQYLERYRLPARIHPVAEPGKMSEGGRVLLILIG